MPSRISTRSASAPLIPVPLSTPFDDADGAAVTGHAPMIAVGAVARPVGPNNPMPVRGASGPIQDASASVGLSSRVVLPAGTRLWLHIENVGVGRLWIGVGQSADTAVGCLVLGPGEGGAGGMMTWGNGGFCPTDAVQVRAEVASGGAVTVKWA